MKARRGPPLSLRATAIRMLARRDYSRVELAQKLIRQGGDPAEVEHIAIELEQLGFLSDTRYAHSLVTQMTGRYAKRAIEHEMKERQVHANAHAAVVPELAEIDDAVHAQALLLRRFPHPPADDREKARQVRFLQSRGYALSLILRLLRERGTATNGEDEA
jgi:regulatory protein